MTFCRSVPIIKFISCDQVKKTLRSAEILEKMEQLQSSLHLQLAANRNTGEGSQRRRPLFKPCMSLSTEDVMHIQRKPYHQRTLIHQVLTAFTSSTAPHSQTQYPASASFYAIHPSSLLALSL